MDKEIKKSAMPEKKKDQKQNTSGTELKKPLRKKSTVSRTKKPAAKAKVSKTPKSDDSAKALDNGTSNVSKTKEKPSGPVSSGIENKPIHQEKKKHSVTSEIEPTTKFIYNLKGKRSIVGLTAYDAIMSKLVSKAGVDFILVGDSVGTTLLGYETTVQVTIDDMVHHTSAVKRGMPECLVVADLPFGEASFSFDRLLESSRRLMQSGADAVKIEGGKDVADDIEKLVATGIPVMGHIGLLPQTVKAIGGYRKFGTDRVEADSIYTDAICLEEAGCFAIIAEMIDGKLATELTKQILPPLIGIGSGDHCDGQILVTHDLLGLTPSPLPSFVKPCASLGLDGLNALQRYVHRIRSM